MIVGDIKAQPICLYLTEHEKYRLERVKENLERQGIGSIWFVRGIHAENSGITCTKIYERDQQNLETGWCIPQKTLGCNLSHYMLYSIMATHPEVEWFFVLEGDAEFVEDWKETLEEELKNVPEDADYIYIGHCCTYELEQVKSRVYKGRCLCGHAYLIRQKSVQQVIEKLGHLHFPIDVELFDYVMPDMNIYLIVPRLSNQINTELPI